MKPHLMIETMHLEGIDGIRAALRWLRTIRTNLAVSVALK